MMKQVVRKLKDVFACNRRSRFLFSNCAGIRKWMVFRCGRKREYEFATDASERVPRVALQKSSTLTS